MVTLNDLGIGNGNPPFIIAEMSGNHNGSLGRALAIVDAAAAAGASAIKLQTYTPDTMTLNSEKEDFQIPDKESLWVNRNLYDLYAEAMTPWEWHDAIFQRAKEHGILAFSTPFDLTAVNFLEKLNVPCYKIASFENVDLKLIAAVSQTGKPVIISTGLATMGMIEEAVTTARENGCQELVLLKTTSTYPADASNSNISTIPHLRQAFRCEVGLSDHTLGIGAAIGAIALGASVIEKHFTLDREDGGVDSAFSLDVAELNSLVREGKTCQKSLGSVHYGPTDAELASLRFKRSLYFVRDLPAGAAIQSGDIRAIRPGFGLPPKYEETLQGMVLTKSVTKGQPVSWNRFTSL